MGRLTERYDITPDGESDVWVKQHDYISAARKLCDYEDLEEQGLLVRLPCKLNGTLYSVNYSNKTIAENTIIKISINDHVKRFYCIDDNLRERIFFSRRIGENVFLTREEAEKKLEELKNEI